MYIEALANIRDELTRGAFYRWEGRRKERRVETWS